MNVKLVPVLLAFAVATACGGSDAGPVPEGPDVDATGVWALGSGTAPSGEVPLVEGYPITLDIDGVSASGVAACNSYGGGIRIEGSTFDAGNFAVTEIGCSPDVTQSQTRYLEAMEAVEEVSVEDDAMTLTGPDAELVFRRLPPVQTKRLVNTTWSLDGLVDGLGPEATVSSARPARLRLADDNTFEGTTGCRGLAGEWSESGDRVVFTNTSFSGSCSPREQAQDDHVITVLLAGFTVEIEGRALTLTSPGDDLGLVYRAK